MSRKNEFSWVWPTLSSVDELDDYLKTQASDGEFQGTGSFVVDFSKARHKIGKYTLAKEEDWVLRLMQGFSRLGALRLDFEVSRKTLTAVATFASEDAVPDLRHLFRTSAVDDPKFPLQDAVWGALNRQMRVELSWGEVGFRVGKDTIEALPTKPSPEHKVVFKVTPAFGGGLFFRVFGKVDYSAEFAEITRVGYLAPYRVFLNGRPFDFESDRFAHGQEHIEVRVQPARRGLRIQAPAFTQYKARYLDADREVSAEVRDYRLLVKVGWGLTESFPLFHWVVDGIRVETHKLREWKSHLRIELYFPADGFPTDLTRLKLVQSRELAEHRRYLERFAVFSLLTVAPLCQREALIPDLVEQQVKRFAADVIKAESFKRPEKAVFKDEIKQHQNRVAIADLKHKLQLEQWFTEKRMHEEVEGAKAASHHSLSREEARFGALATSGIMDAPEAGEWKPKAFGKPKPTREKVETFLGEVYVELPRKPTPEVMERPHVPRRHKKR